MRNVGVPAGTCASLVLKLYCRSAKTTSWRDGEEFRRTNSSRRMTGLHAIVRHPMVCVYGHIRGVTGVSSVCRAASTGDVTSRSLDRCGSTRSADFGWVLALKVSANRTDGRIQCNMFRGAPAVGLYQCVSIDASAPATQLARYSTCQ